MTSAGTVPQQQKDTSSDTSTIETFTPPSPAFSILLPPSATVGNSPVEQPPFSKDRDLERLRKATTTATASPRRDRQNGNFQQSGEAEPDPKAAPFKHVPLASGPLSPEEDSELDEPSRVGQGLSTSFVTPPRPHQGTRHKHNQFQTPPPRLDDLPKLPPPLESPDSLNDAHDSPTAKDKEFSFPPGSLNEINGSLGPKTPRPPGARNNGTAAPPTPDSLETRVEGGPRGIQTPASPGSWAIKLDATPAPDNMSMPLADGDNAQLTNGLEETSGAMRTPAPPGVWSSAASASNSLKKGILNVQFDKTSVASWNKLQRDDASECGNSFAFTGEKADEFGNALKEQPALEDSEETGEFPPSTTPFHDDDLPATPEEIRGLRRVARAVPRIASEFADER